MTMTFKSRRRLPRALRWFSTGRTGARTNVEPSSQMVREFCSVGTAHRDKSRFLTVNACARSRSLPSGASSAALKSP
jgi:hypothetical protein